MRSRAKICGVRGRCGGSREGAAHGAAAGGGDAAVTLGWVISREGTVGRSMSCCVRPEASLWGRRLPPAWRRRRTRACGSRISGSAYRRQRLMAMLWGAWRWCLAHGGDACMTVLGSALSTGRCLQAHAHMSIVNCYRDKISRQDNCISFNADILTRENSTVARAWSSSCAHL